MATFAEKMLDELASGQIDQAKKSYASALRHDDDDTIYSLAEELYGLGFTNQAKRAYTQLLAKYPQEDQLRTALADIAIDEDKADEALEYLAGIEADSDAYLEALLVMADLYSSEGLVEAAEEKLLQAKRLAPDEPIIDFALAEHYFSIAKYEEAIPYYRGLLAMGERRFSGLDIASRIGVAYALTGENDTALGYLEQIKPADLTPDIRFQLAMLYAADEEKHDQAIEALEELEDLDRSYAGLYEPLGQLYEQKGDIERALITYQAGLAVDAFNLQLVTLAAQTAQKLGQMDVATKIYQEGLENNPGDLTLVLGYSNLLIAVNDHIGNVNLLNEYLSDDDAEVDPIIYWNLAQSYQALEDYEMATKFWNAALPFYLTNPDFLRPAYFYFREEGELALAKEAISNYLQIVPDDTEMIELYDEIRDDI
ncbi:tetratricopeptide repeat family protein [Weissella oryzae SG25]|uniref:Tetratricopeptide repeat family protein n=1 Tax=Weissella oryzae (strain DSM 25784 / JCM 18191 / LMG 30913 / SG25) TaxID=1329250 RepID=A0A069D1T3_WEIOS|nr:tetratricopeptide repeat protein [Weissella oryzae]GAK31291.1 tetratricopeptide repeat family protein [Weissella oryzae SG25]